MPSPAYPNGQCPACGTGADGEGACTDDTCSNYGLVMVEPYDHDQDDSARIKRRWDHYPTVEAAESDPLGDIYTAEFAEWCEERETGQR